MSFKVSSDLGHRPELVSNGVIQQQKLRMT